MPLIAAGMLFGCLCALANAVIGNSSPVEALAVYAVAGYLAIMGKILISITETPQRAHL